jgi:hypothetical protein
MQVENELVGLARQNLKPLLDPKSKKQAMPTLFRRAFPPSSGHWSQSRILGTSCLGTPMMMFQPLPTCQLISQGASFCFHQAGRHYSAGLGSGRSLISQEWIYFLLVQVSSVDFGRHVLCMHPADFMPRLLLSSPAVLHIASATPPVLTSPHLTTAFTQVYVILFGVGERDTEGIYSLRAFGEDGLPQETIIVFEAEEDAQR